MTTMRGAPSSAGELVDGLGAEPSGVVLTACEKFEVGWGLQGRSNNVQIPIAHRLVATGGRRGRVGLVIREIAHGDGGHHRSPDANVVNVSVLSENRKLNSVQQQEKGRTQ